MIRAGRFSAHIFTSPSLGYRIIEDGKGCVGTVYLPECTTRRQAKKDATADVTERDHGLQRQQGEDSPRTGR